MNVLAIVPARGGSKGVPRKNVKSLAGKPLLEYTLEAVSAAASVSEIAVTSDCAEVLSIAAGYTGVHGVQRPAELSQDESSVIVAVEHVMQALSGQCDDTYDVLLLLQPTSPLRSSRHIDEALTLLQQNPEAQSVISVCESQDMHPARMYWHKDNTLQPIMPESELTRRQDLQPAYHRNGAIYAVRRSAFTQQGSLMAKPAIPYVMPAEESINIDSLVDWQFAEFVMSQQNRANEHD